MTNKNDDATTVSIMEIERFAIHDGPGIRTLVFLQGCPLVCSWCSNPESQKIRTHLMYMQNKCIACHQCYAACAYDAITIVNNKPQFDRNKCTMCKKCGDTCPSNAIRFVGETVSVNHIMNIVRKDKAYYDNSGGGITLSGGEAFVQFDGLMRILTRCKAEGIHTAIETCGQTDWNKIAKTLPLTDLYLFDIKHTNKELLYAHTKGNWDLISSNLAAIAAQNAHKIIIRVPVLPGYNFNEPTITEIFELALRNKIQHVHLLPYHTLGKDKYQQLGMPYTFGTDSMLAKDDLLPFKALGEMMGLSIQLGG